MSLLLLFAGAEQGAGPVFTATATDLVIALPDYMVRGPQYVVPFITDQTGAWIQDQTGAGLIGQNQLTLDEIVLPALYVRRVQ